MAIPFLGRGCLVIGLSSSKTIIHIAHVFRLACPRSSLLSVVFSRANLCNMSARSLLPPALWDLTWLRLSTRLGSGRLGSCARPICLHGSRSMHQAALVSLEAPHSYEPESSVPSQSPYSRYVAYFVLLCFGTLMAVSASRRRRKRFSQSLAVRPLGDAAAPRTELQRRVDALAEVVTDVGI